MHRKQISETRHVVVVSGGAPPPPALAARIAPADAVICADRGYEFALALGLSPTLIVGDFDSLSPVRVNEAQRAGVSVELHPTDKDATDLELALDRATSDKSVESGAGVVTLVTVVTVVATPDLHDRVDHFLAQLGLLASPRYAHVRINAWFGEAFVTIAHPSSPANVTGSPGELVSIIPIGGDASGVRTSGLVYPLSGETLTPFSTRGVSNVLDSFPASVHVTDGVVAVIRPHALRGPQ